MGKQLVVVACLLLAVATATSIDQLEEDVVSTYIVHVEPGHAPRPTLRGARLNRAYTSFVGDLLPAHLSHPAPRLLYSYVHAATGFAVRLTERQAAHLEAQPPIVAVARETVYELHTTHSSSFLQLSPYFGLEAASNGGTDVVIGVLDTGVYPKDRASFAADPSLPPPPSTFHGGCESTPDFNGSAYCNNKLVGAKAFYEGYKARVGHPRDGTEESESMSPLDTNGHGTHTASTAAGSAVPNANFLGLAVGTAKGTAPGARIAVYKICWQNKGCPGADILAGIDAAIGDGVDIISLSVGAFRERLVDDQVSRAAFSAVRKGIVVSVSAGNNGPSRSKVGNIAPWVLTVGASSMNRRFPAVVVLGNDQIFVGTSLHPGDPNGLLKSLVYGGDAGSALCEIGKLYASKVAGKIVLCEAGKVADVEKGVAVDKAGGFGAIISGSKERGEYVTSSAHLIPTAVVPYASAVEIRRYMSSGPYPVAKILFFGTVLGSPPSAPSPRVASFSSRGPSVPAPEILKPDLVAPGVDILAAWTGLNSPSKNAADQRRVEFNIISGTSMACPHVSGIAALLKKAKPSWSPAAIKSALMTTAYNVDNSGNAIRDMATGKAAGPFELGAGHVDPNRALDPGLVYDAGTEDYISFLCAMGVSEDQIRRLYTRDATVIKCSARPNAKVRDVNLPSFSVVFKAYGDSVTLRRVVRNVGSKTDAVYTVVSVPPPGTQLRIKPSKLVFDAEHQTQEYTMTVLSVSSGNFTKYTHGSIVWSDGVHKVRSPIAVIWPLPQAQSAAVAAI